MHKRIELEKLCPEMGIYWVTEKRLSELTGLTPKALQRKRQRGTLTSDVYRKKDGRIMYNTRRFHDWVEAGNQ